ncbi:hypothetical protein ACIA8O_04845 [Kitasatospora sp. NPDC051853]
MINDGDAPPQDLVDAADVLYAVRDLRAPQSDRAGALTLSQR